MSCAAASVDGLYAAIARDGELSLYTVEPFAEIARAQLAPPTGERTVAFVGRQVLVHEPARLTLYSVPQRLAITGQLELASPTRLLATSQHYALLATSTETSIASCTSEGVAIAPTRTPTIVERGVGLEHAKFLTWPKKGATPGPAAEMWDAASRLPAARVGLELPPDTTDVGTTGKHRSVWIATAGGDLIVSRLSDGKTTVAPLPRPPQRIASHPLSAWLVMDFDGAPHAVNSVLRSWQHLEVPAQRPRALAPSIGSHAYVIVDEGDEVARYEVGIDAAPRPPVRISIGAPLPDGEDATVAAPPTPIVRVEHRRFEVDRRDEPARGRVESPRDLPSSMAGGSEMPSRADVEPRRELTAELPSPADVEPRREPSWRDRMSARGDAKPESSGDRLDVRSLRGVPGSSGHDGRDAPVPGDALAPPTSTLASRAQASSLASRFAQRDREPGRMRPIGSPLSSPPPAPAATVPSPADWHDALFQWSRRVLGEAPTAELPPMRSPVTALADRARLDVPARRILHALYADWLAGHGDVGLAAAKLVEIAGPTAWQEALANGQLGKRGLVRSEVGRALLARAAGAFFDGREPEHVRRVDGGGQRDGIEDGAYRVRRATHAQLATALGTIGVSIGGGDRDAARLEAWLRGWPVVLEAMTPTELRPGELVLVEDERAGLPDLPGV